MTIMLKSRDSRTSRIVLLTHAQTNVPSVVPPAILRGFFIPFIVLFHLYLCVSAFSTAAYAVFDHNIFEKIE